VLLPQLVELVLGGAEVARGVLGELLGLFAFRLVGIAWAEHSESCFSVSVDLILAPCSVSAHAFRFGFRRAGRLGRW